MWHKCRRYWIHGLSCPVAARLGHKDDDDDADDGDLPLEIPLPAKQQKEATAKPAQIGSVVTVAIGIVEEAARLPEELPKAAINGGRPAVDSGKSQPLPGWVPPPRDIVVPPLYPSPAELPGVFTTPQPPTTALPPPAAPQPGGGFIPGPAFSDLVPTAGATPALIPGSGVPALGDAVVKATIAVGVGVGMGILVAAGAPWVERIIAASRALAAARAMGTGEVAPSSVKPILAALGGLRLLGMADTRDEELPEAIIEQLVVDYVLPTAGERAVRISEALRAGRDREKAAEVPYSTSGHDPTTEPSTSGFTADPFFEPTGAGAGGFLVDFGQYLNTQLTESPSGGSPSPISY